MGVLKLENDICIYLQKHNQHFKQCKYVYEFIWNLKNITPKRLNFDFQLIKEIILFLHFITDLLILIIFKILKFKNQL